MKTLRIMHLVVCFILLFPLIVIIEVVDLVLCIRAAKVLNEPMKRGLVYWYNHLKEGILMNKDFVLNGR